jgi:DNA (cytosine-5)-methyltransferase 1
MTHTFYDAFSGIGGIRLGMEKAGFTCVGSCEIDPAARETYALNFGSEPKHTDIYGVESLPYNTSVLCGGFPCQAFSNLGKRQGFKDPNGNLFFELARLISASQPKGFLFENVKGLVNHNRGQTFNTILTTLEKLGYSTSWQVLNAKDFDLPQRRERVFIVGFRNFKIAKRFEFPEGHYNVERSLSTIIQENVGKEYVASNAMLVGYLKKLHSRGPNKGGRFLPALHSPDEVGNTLVTYGDRILIFDRKVIRRLTPREWARMQGFPDSFKLSSVKTKAYRQIGNSVPVPVITAIANKMANVMKTGD